MIYSLTSFLENPPDYIIRYPNSVLRQQTENINIDELTLKQLETISCVMFKLMHKHKGVGLSGPQVALPYSIFVCKLSKTNLVCINPIILGRSEKTTKEYEGCLSIPNVEVLVKRPKSIILAYTNLIGELEKKQFKDLDARIIQHEYAHLQGRLILDHITG